MAISVACHGDLANHTYLMLVIADRVLKACAYTTANGLTHGVKWAGLIRHGRLVLDGRPLIIVGSICSTRYSTQVVIALIEIAHLTWGEKKR